MLELKVLSARTSRVDFGSLPEVSIVVSGTTVTARKRLAQTGA